MESFFLTWTPTVNSWLSVDSAKTTILMVFSRNMASLTKFQIIFALLVSMFYCAKIIWNFVSQAIFQEQTIIVTFALFNSDMYNCERHRYFTFARIQVFDFDKLGITALHGWFWGSLQPLISSHGKKPLTLSFVPGSFWLNDLKKVYL